jgi:protein involved in polysaccharide export with SLBB domain
MFFVNRGALRAANFLVEIVAATRSMINKFVRWSSVLAIGLQLGGCFTDYGPVVVYSPPVAPFGVALRLQTGEELKINVYGEEALSGVYDISPGGTITMPLIGPIVAAGLTKEQLESALTTAYASGKFLQDPKISVFVATYRPFYIFGEVQTPGRYAYTTGLDVLTAVATAGGFTYRADKSTVLIRHPGENLWREYSLAAPLPVVPGDLIRITERYF